MWEVLVALVESQKSRKFSVCEHSAPCSREGERKEPWGKTLYSKKMTKMPLSRHPRLDALSGRGTTGLGNTKVHDLVLARIRNKVQL